MPRKANRLPNRFPVGTKYIVESRGGVKGMTLMHRYVEFPNGRQVELAARLVQPCGAAQTAEIKAPVSRARRSQTRRRRTPALVPTA